MAETIDIDIVAHDKTSSVLTGIFQGIGQSLANFAMQIPGAIMHFGASILAEANEAELGLADLKQTLISTGGAAGMTEKELLSLADSLSKTTRFSDDAVLAGENMLLTFTNIGKDVFPDATKALADLATKMKSDMPQAAIQLGKALNDPIGGIDALRRVGVQFTDAQKDVVAALIKTGDVAGAQRIILAELNKEFGGQAEAAGGTFAGQMDILTNRFNDMKETVGMALIPVLTELMDKVIMPLVPYIEAAAQSFANWLPTLIPFADRIANMADVIWSYLQPAFQWLSDWWNANGADITFKATVLWDTLWRDINAFIEKWNTDFKPLFDSLASWWDENGEGIISKAKDLWKSMTDGASETSKNLLKLVDENLPKLSAWWDENGGKIAEVASFAFDNMGRQFTFVSDLINLVLLPALDHVISIILDMGTIILSLATGDWATAWTAIKDMGKNQMYLLLDIIKGVLDTILRQFGTTFDDVVKIVALKIAEAGDELNKIFEKVKTTIEQIGGLTAYGLGLQESPDSGMRAGGGSVRAGGSYLVGEQGAEMFVPSSSGNIIPNGGGGNISIVLNYAPSVALGNRQEAESTLLPYILSGIRAAQANGYLGTT